MSVRRIFSKVCSIKLSDCKDDIDYIGRYKVVFDKIQSLITEGLWISKKTDKIVLQKSLFWHLGRNYSALVTVIETVWKDETTNLSDTIFWVIRHTEINKDNEEDSADVSNAKILAANIYKAPKRTCIVK